MELPSSSEPQTEASLLRRLSVRPPLHVCVCVRAVCLHSSLYALLVRALAIRDASPGAQQRPRVARGRRSERPAARRSPESPARRRRRARPEALALAIAPGPRRHRQGALPTNVLAQNEQPLHPYVHMCDTHFSRAAPGRSTGPCSRHTPCPQHSTITTTGARDAALCRRR